MRVHQTSAPSRPALPTEGKPSAGGVAPNRSSVILNGSVKKILRNRPEEFLDLACKAVRATHAGIGFLSAEGNLIEYIAHGGGAGNSATVVPAAGIRELLAFIVRQARPVRVAEPAFDCRCPAAALLRPLPGALQAVPLVRPGRFPGALYVTRPAGEAGFTLQDEEVVLSIGACLEQENLFEQAHLLSQMRLLNRVAQAAAGNLELKPVLQVALRELERHLPMNACAVWLVDQQDAPPTAGATGPPPELVLAATNPLCESGAHGPALALGARLPLDQTPFGPCWREGQPVYTDWGPAESSVGQGDEAPVREADGRVAAPLSAAPLEPLLTGQQALSSFAAPLRTGDRTVGILQSVCTRPSGFTNEQIQLLYLVADMLGPAISNCHLVDRLRSTCEELRATRDFLIQAEKMRALGEMASGMAHDFNNALCGVLGFLELSLTDTALSANTRGQLELARTSALDAAHTVRRVQEFARKRHSSTVVLQPLDVNDLVRQVVELTRPKWESQARAREMPITVELHTEATGTILGNSAELREALTNLVFNAIDAMPKGGTLGVRTWCTQAGVFLEVRDTGVGMSPAVRQRLFEPFFTTKGDRGNGLGLSVVCGIVERHGGEITASSEVGQGSAFTVRLPVSLAGAVRSAGTGSAPQATAPAISLRILVVEDEQPIRSFLARTLTKFGHRPRLTANGAEALEAFAAEPFDVVLTDLGMPGISGIELARTVAQRSPKTPVILLTGWGDQLKGEGKSLEGITQILGKPVTIDHLITALKAVKPG